MEWIFLESLLALLIGVFIVWWTMRPTKRDREDNASGPPDSGGDASRG